MEASKDKRQISRSLTSRSTYVDYDYLIKVVIIGDSGVGKSQLVGRFTRNEFSSRSRQTIGVEFATKTIAVNYNNICVQLWDTAGEERYRALASAYYRGAVGVLLVFDVTNQKSFKNLTHWLNEVKSYTTDKCQIMLVGNKIDLASTRKVTVEQASAFAHSNKMDYIETSAKQCTNVNSSFETLITQIYYRTLTQDSDKNNATATSTTTRGMYGHNAGRRLSSGNDEARKPTFTCCWGS